MFIKKTYDKFLSKLANLEYGSLELIMPDGNTHIFQGYKPDKRVNFKINHWNVIPNLILKGDIGLAEDYRDGKWETNNLQDLITASLKNRKILNKYITGSKVSKIISRLNYLTNLNTLKGSRKNIQAHYDLGNDFYKLWLDPSMSYSSAYYQAKGYSLEQAQHAKYDRIIDKIKDCGPSVLEIGCGWGGFAERALISNIKQVRGLTLSTEQKNYCDQRLNNNADIVLEDYRIQTGKYDSIVSIEMFEAVGEKYWPVYFNKIAELLKKDGKAVIQTIIIDDDLFDSYRKSGDFIRSYIFPGGMLPSLSRFKSEALKAGLKVTDQFAFGLDYARTLEEWLNTFDNKAQEIKALGYDDKFIRIWRFYLAVCIAGFKSKQTDVYQLQLEHV